MTAVETLSLTEVAEAIARGEVSALSVTERTITRLKEFGPVLNCVIRLDETEALQEAVAADKARAAGKPLGSLHGVPLAHKDLFYRAGHPCTGGSKIRHDFVPKTTATVLERLGGAGSINVGTLHMAEFAMSPTGYNEHYGHCRNPWNLDHVPGGSSSGSGASVAARLVYGSLGSDTGGSIRHPAAMCGITGVKPTWSRVSRAGVMPLSWSLDCIGPLARTARDCARLLRVIAGTDPSDPTASTQPVPDYEAGLTGNCKGLRVAVPRSYYYDYVTKGVKDALDGSLATLRHCGVEIVESGVPDMALVNAMAHVLLAVEGATIHRKWFSERPQDYADQVVSRLEPGLYYPATRYAEALALRGKIAAEYLAKTMGSADAIHLPAVSVPVPSIAETTEGDSGAVTAEIGVITHCTRGLNYVGLPVIGIPCGFAEGLPVGFQLVGRPFAEATILRIADAFQRVTDFHLRLPPLTQEAQSEGL
jgi:aspartyl-tRNA(Asn)/glutamyl-tRNA(Gln) amidotransferase subunit A